jgi:hypothetical protein
MEGIDIEIDKLTNSITNRVSGDVFDTEVLKMTPSDWKNLKKKDWVFNWKKESTKPNRTVFKLIIEGNHEVIQGLVALENMHGFVYLSLVESISYNKGANKLYEGVAGNLFAYACKVSDEFGFDGFVAFDAKTALINHYQKTLGATIAGGARMFIDEIAAYKLIERYFNKKS